MKTRGQEHDAIRREIEKYSWKTFQKFSEIFPCMAEVNDDPRYVLDIFSKEYLEKQLVDSDDPYITHEFLILRSPEDFWNRWNRFKNLKVFL